MKRNIFKLFLFTLFLGVGFTSCDTNDYNWVRSNFNYEMPPISRNGDYRTTDVIYLEDIDRGINDINVKNAWITARTDSNYGFDLGDDIIINSITINGQRLSLNYHVNVGPSLEGSKNISFENDNDYIDFMYNAMRLLNNRGQIQVSVDGSSDMLAGNLYIVLGNNLEILVDR